MAQRKASDGHRLSTGPLVPMEPDSTVAKHIQTYSQSDWDGRALCPDRKLSTREIWRITLLVPVLATVHPKSSLLLELFVVTHLGRRVVHPLDLRQDGIAIRAALGPPVVGKTAPDRRYGRALPEIAP